MHHRLRLIEYEDGSLRLLSRRGRGRRYVSALRAAGITVYARNRRMDDLEVPAAQAQDARGVIAQLEADLDTPALRDWRRSLFERRRGGIAPPSSLDPLRPYAWPWLMTLWSLVILFLHGVQGDAGGIILDGRLVMEGRLDLCVGALFNHADWLHVTANAVGLVAAGLLLAGSWGQGLSLLLVLAAAAGGNLLSVFLQGQHYRALGASTAVFAGLGLACGAALRAHIGGGGSWRKSAWTLVLALLFLGWFGSSAQSDVLAHACGLAVGLALGLVAGLQAPRAWMSPARQLAAALLAIALAGAVLVAGGP